MALASSFGADSIEPILLIVQCDRTLPVLFLDIGQLCAETMRYQRALAADFGLTDLRVIRPDPAALRIRDTDGILHQADQNACCRVRKVEPLQKAVVGFGGWITGRKRIQGGRRVALEFFGLQDKRVKVNPLAHWSRDELRACVTENALPLHPLQAKSFFSIGCDPCTVPTRFGEAARAGVGRGRGRWIAASISRAADPRGKGHRRERDRHRCRVSCRGLDGGVRRGRGSGRS